MMNIKSSLDAINTIIHFILQSCILMFQVSNISYLTVGGVEKRYLYHCLQCLFQECFGHFKTVHCD